MFCKIPWHFANKSYICTYSYLSYYLVIYLFLTILMDSYGFFGIFFFLDSYRFFGIFMDSLGFFECSHHSFRILMDSLGFFGILMDSLGFFGYSYQCFRILWDSLGFFNLFQISIIFEFLANTQMMLSFSKNFESTWYILWLFFAQNHQSFLAVRCSKKSPHQETGFGNRERLKVLNDTKLVLNEH